MTKIVTVISITLGIVLALSSVAHADETDVPRAQQAFTRGLAQVGKNDLESARRSFLSAYALVPSIDILWNLAMTERRLGRNVDALHHLRTYVADSAARPDRREIARTEFLPELGDLTARIVVRAAEGAIVEMDGAALTANTVDVEPGVHTLATKDGSAQARAVDVAAGSTTTIDLMPVAVVPPSSSPPLLLPRRTETPSSSSSSSSSGWSTRTWTLAGLGGGAVVLAAGGIVFASLSAFDRARAERLYTEMSNDDLSCAQSGTICTDHDSARAAADRTAAAATTMFVLSGVLAGATVTTWLLWPKDRVTPSAFVSKDGGAVALTGRF